MKSIEKRKIKILIGVTGSIAAYKIAELTRLLKKSNYEVRIVMTKSAKEFITPMTLQVLSQNPVRSDLFDHEKEQEIDHISLARWADFLIIAPATANIIAKIAVGIADDLLSTICLATNSQIIIAPAMNQAMWANKITQKNLQTLLQNGVKSIAPNSGDQACGEIGFGRMAEPIEILEYIRNQETNNQNNGSNQSNDNQILKGKHILITAGATIERIDPVRYISNFSSGKMGFAIANTAVKLGAKVTLISNQNSLFCDEKITKITIESAVQMHDAVHNVLKNKNELVDWFISTAAISDYRVKQIAEQKLKKIGDNPSLQLELVANPDILQSVCSKKNEYNTNIMCVGFAAETENLLEFAKTKLNKKGAHLICANDVSESDIGFNSDMNEITVIGNDNFKVKLEKQSKTVIAEQLLQLFNSYENKLNSTNKKF